MHKLVLVSVQVWCYYYDDFRDSSADDFLYQMTLQGAQITVGLTF
jgi:hypothetical protein